MFLVVFVWNIQKKNVNNHFVYVFQASPKRLNSFEWVMCPLYAQPSIFTLAVFFYLGDLGKQEWKADTIPLCRFFFICPLAYLFWCYTLTSRVGDRSDSLLSWNCRRSATSGYQCVPLERLQRSWEMRSEEKNQYLSHDPYVYPLLHRNLHTLIANPCYYDGALLGRERNVAIYWFCSAESLAVKSIEADCLVVVETGDGDETSCRLDGDATLFCWFNTIGVFDSFNSSKVAPRRSCFISLDCRCRDVKSSICDIWTTESTIIGWWNCLCVNIDVFYICTKSESIISWLSVLYALNGRKVAMWILFRYEKVIFNVFNF